jgi:diguanylate cyclase (GGDEF)-like protein
LPEQTIFSSDEALSYIEPNNILAEIEGRNNYILQFKDRLKKIIDEHHLYIPIKSNHPLWLHVGFKMMSKNTDNHQFIFGTIHQVFNKIPNPIIYYQKTYQDPLTKLFTRETLKMHLAQLKHIDGAYGMYIDIDYFKSMNDQFGHHAGDRLLVDIANYFVSKWEQNVLYYRLGGDEFFIYVYLHSETEVIERAKRIIYDIENLTEETKKLGISASIGIVPVTSETKEYYTLLDLGDHMMYVSKAKGPGNVTLKKL